LNIAEFPVAVQFLFAPHRYKVLWGGRGAAKSWAIARALLLMGAQKPLRILCARETQKSIADSVHKLLCDQISALGLQERYRIERARIIGTNGTEFVFAGLKHDPHSLKSYEAIDIVWIEEAQNVSDSSWAILIPTIRKPGSEIWISFNPILETDATYRRFVASPPPTAKVVKLTWRDNPWFPETLREELEHLKATDAAAYSHVWEGTCVSIVDGAIYAAELRAVDAGERITRVPYDPTRPVHTAWDLGWGDAMAIWFVQATGREYHVIDYLEGNQKPLQHYIAAMQARGYVYGTDYLPHDARAHELGTGRSIEEMLRAAGRTVYIVPRLSIADGIAAARSIFPLCWFDRERTKDGIQALRHYRYVKDETLGIAKREPLHDWSSNGSDAFRYLAVSIRQPEIERREIRELRMFDDSSDDAWMA